MALPQYPQMDVEDYLILDDNSKNVRYEYLDGEIRMLTGGSTYHSIIKTNLTGIIYGLLRKKPCRAFDSDIRLQLSPTRYIYPDLVISCDQRDLTFGKEIRYPRVIVEVLSQSTEVTDRTKKFAYYREYPTVEEYIMIDSRKILVEVYRREGKKWSLYTFNADEEVQLASLDIQFSVADVYEDINFDTMTAHDPED
jgi:Uma2 family endonuclease